MQIIYPIKDLPSQPSGSLSQTPFLSAPCPVYLRLKIIQANTQSIDLLEIAFAYFSKYLRGIERLECSDPGIQSYRSVPLVLGNFNRPLLWKNQKPSPVFNNYANSL